VGHIIFLFQNLESFTFFWGALCSCFSSHKISELPLEHFTSEAAHSPWISGWLVLLPQILCAFLVVAASSGTAAARRHVPPEAGPAGEQSNYLAPTCREHTASLTDFGGVGDGTTSNTAAFQKAVAHLSQYSGEGGGGSMLYVPAGKWLTAPFNLTSHFTLFLHADAVILASQVVSSVCWIVSSVSEF
jgi:polygalacturonase